MEALNLPAVVLSLLLQLSSVATPARSNFSGDSALAVLRVLSVDIGPRPMGSPAEQRAIHYAMDRFRDFGCQQAYVMPMTVADNVNTNSGIAIGVLKGETERIIVIGAHIDSEGPAVPGANDDGSGVACVIELARVLSQQQHESTIMFCCWGGEEQGLQGSKYFVNHFEKLDSVDLMLQIDMADGSRVLEIDPDYGKTSAPRWLTKAAYEIFFDELHSEGLVYPIASATLNAAIGSAAGSDHDSFLEKGIPAIDFTSDVDYPIHTPLDNLTNFTPGGLKKTGDLVFKLVERFDAGVPSRMTEQYMLLQVGTAPVFLPHWILWSIFGITLMLAFAAILILRSRRVHVEGAPRIRWSAIKLIIFTLVIQAFTWLSETLMGFVAGYRFPWVNNFFGYALLGILFGLIGLWVALNASRRFPLTQDAYLLGRNSLVILIILTLLAALRGPELSTFFALATAFMSLAILLRASVVRIGFWILSVLTALRLVFVEELGLIQRLLSQNTIHTMGGLIGYESIFIIFFAFLSLPFMFGFAALYRDSGRDLFFLRRFRERNGLWLISFAAIGLMTYLLLHRPYGQKWFGRIVVQQNYTVGADSSTITLKGSEYLRGLRLVVDGRDVVLVGRTNFHQFQPSQSSFVSWCSMDVNYWPGSNPGENDSLSRMDRRITIHSRIRPYRVNVKYSSTSPFDVSSPWAYRHSEKFEKESDNVRVFSWYSFPDTLIEIPITLTLSDSQRVSEKIEVTFDALAYPLRLEKNLTYFEMSTVVTETHEFGVRNDSTDIVSRPQ